MSKTLGKHNFDSTTFKAVVIGGSAGSFQVITKILAEINPAFDLPIFMAMHRLKHVRNGFVEALMLKSKLQIVEPDDKQPVKKGIVYLAPSNYHMSVEFGYKIALSTEEMVNNSRPSIDITFDSTSYVYKSKILGIMLSGANKDGAVGMKRLKDRGGITVVQDPEECMIDTMVKGSMELTTIDYILKTEGIIKLLNSLV